MDANWFYSALAQCSAAIVAIYGGFISSRLIQISGEKESLQRRCREKSLELESGQKRLELIKDEKENFIVDEVIDDAYPVIIASIIRGVIPAAEKVFQFLQEKKGIPPVNIELFNREFDNITSEVEKTVKLFTNNQHLFQYPDLPELEEFIDKAKVDFRIYKRAMVDDVYDQFKRLKKEEHREIEEEIRRKKIEEQQKALKASQLTGLRLFPRISYPDFANLAANIDFPILSESSRLFILSRQLAEKKEREKKKEEVDKDANRLQQNIFKLETEISMLGDQVQLLKIPSGVKEGFCYLIILAVVGIILPLWIIPTAKYEAVLKREILTAFTLSLTLLFLHIEREIRFLTIKKSKSEVLNSHKTEKKNSK